VGDGREEGRALGAVAQAVGRVFHVTAAEDAAVLAFQRRADLELRVRDVGQFARGAGFFDEFFVFHVLPDYGRIVL
jgi:hypothetical protein